MYDETIAAYPAAPDACVTEDQILAAVEHLCASRRFKRSPSLIAFLRFVVDATVHGNARSLKAYSIAVGALGKSDRFDPVADASVRVNARRLRRALEEYYSDDGLADDIRISIPRGGYVPIFKARHKSDIRIDGQEAEEHDRLRATGTSARRVDYSDTHLRVKRLQQELKKELSCLQETMAEYRRTLARFRAAVEN